MDWDQYFIMMAYTVALKSKDESTKLGAVITTLDNSLVSTGYNSFPRGLKDNIEQRQKRPNKYHFFVHAESNAIFHSARCGSKTNDCKMYTQGLPRENCALAIIQSGIKQVYIHNQWEKKAERIFDEWESRKVDSVAMFNECGVEVKYLDLVISNDHIQIKTCIRGEWFDI